MFDSKFRLVASIVLFITSAFVLLLVCVSLFLYKSEPDDTVILAPAIAQPIPAEDSIPPENLDAALPPEEAHVTLEEEHGSPVEEVLPMPSPSEPRIKTILQTYTVKRGDTLNVIAARFGKTAAGLARLNGIRNANRIEVGQVLRIGYVTITVRPPVTYPGPAELLVPDSEVVYGPAFKNFSVQAVAEKYGGYLVTHRELVEGQWMTGPQIVQLVAERYSVGPRVLLSMLELRSGWLTQRSIADAQREYPIGYEQAGFNGLFYQLSWAAQRLNAAYYLSYQNELDMLSLFDGDQIKLARGLNPGSIAVQNVISRASNWATFNEQVTNGDFAHTYKSLFGEPFAFEVKTIVPDELTQPVFRLPWEDEHLWWFTGGPHNGWAPGSAWAAVDFAPTSARGTCRTSAEWAVAVAPGQVVQAEKGRVVVDLDGDGFQGTGWSLLYMHIATRDRIAVGTKVKTGDRIGHPSCEGGYSTGTHLHLARLYNGQWIPAADESVPMNLAGWVIKSNDVHYDGLAIYNQERRESSGGWDEAKNGIRAMPSLLAGTLRGEQH